jgi:hypothetical protein
MVRTKPLGRTSLLREGKYSLHVGVVAATINCINLVAVIPATKLIRCAEEAEWVCSNYDKLLL